MADNSAVVIVIEGVTAKSDMVDFDLRARDGRVYACLWHSLHHQREGVPAGSRVRIRGVFSAAFVNTIEVDAVEALSEA